MAWAYVNNGQVVNVTKYRAGGEPYTTLGIFRQPEAFLANDHNYPAAVFTALSTEEMAGIGLAPLVSDETPDGSAYTWESTFEVQGNQVLEHYTTTDKDSEVLSASLALLVEAQCGIVDSNEATLRAEGVVFNGSTVQIRVPPEEDIQFISSCVLAAVVAQSGGPALNVQFTMADNTNVTITDPAVMTALGTTAMARVQAIHNAAQTVKAAVRTAGAPAVNLTAAQYIAKRDAVRAVSLDLSV